MLKKIILVLLISLPGFCTIGQELYFKSLTVNDGLTQHDVSCFLQDSFGFIWIGTYDGLNRYDGFNVLNFSHKTNDIESLSSNRILSLFEDSKKRIWIGTDGSGLNYYSLVTEKFIRVKTPEGYNQIKGIAETSKGEIFFATSRGVLKLVENDMVSVDLLQLPITGLNITGITIVGDDQVYFSTNQGIWTLKANTCKQIPGTQNIYCSQLIADRHGNLWSALNGKLTVVKNINDSYKLENINSLQVVGIMGICESKDGTIWVGTLNNGLFGLHPQNYSIIQSIKYKAKEERGLLSNSLLSLYCDNTNVLWVGNRQGLCYANLSQKDFKRVSFEGLTNVPNKPHIRTLLVDNNFLYYGIQDRGFFRYSLKNETHENLNSDNNLDPLCLKEINGTIYAGSNAGILLMRKDDSHFVRENLETNHDPIYPIEVTSICEDEKGSIYFGTFSGLIVRKGSTTDWIQYLHPQAEILRGKRIFSLLYDKDAGCIWIGTISDGLYKLNVTKEGSFLSLEVYNELMQNDYQIANNTIWCFYKGKDGTLWIGTDAGLLRKPKNSNKISQINIPGIVDRKIMGILEDDRDNLWLTNSQGLIRFDVVKSQVRRYSYNDGLQSSTFTEAVGKGQDGTLFFGSIHGINYLNPMKIADNPYKSAVSISDFKIHNISITPKKSYFGKVVLDQSINLTNEITLNYKQNNFLFEFTGTNYANTAENHFRYKLDGYDSDWIYETGNRRFASYSNLKSGIYTFWVDAANSDGIWNDSPRKVEIKILPAPWFSIWAYLLYFTFITGIVLGFIFFLNNRQKLRHQIELKNIQYNRDKEINEIKLMFFTDVAHEFKTPLSLIIGPLNDLIHNNITEEHRNFCFKIISRNTKRMMFLVSQLLDFRTLNANKNILKISESDLSEFISQITKAFLWQAKNEEINFNVITPEVFQCFFDSDLIEKVVYNLLSNAFKYTPANGIVEIEIKSVWNNNKQIANIIVRDSGRGIPDEQKGKIFDRFFHGNDRASSGIGLHLSNTFIKAHKGELNVADSAYGGAEFIVTIPVSKNNYEDFELYDSNGQKMIADNFLSEIEVSKKEVAEERECILIVEDDHDLRAYLKNCLHINYNVLEAPNGIEGLKKATVNLPDIIVADVMMPEMDGIEMCKRLKANQETSHIPVLMLTAKTAEEQQNEGLDAGAWDYITKPFNTQSLLKKIENIIDSRKSFRNTIFNPGLSIELKKHYTPFDQKLISKAIVVIENNIGNENFSAEDFSREVGFSRMQLHRKLKSLVGCSASEFINTIKINYATKMFDNGCDRINEAMEAIGITSYSHFNKLFKKINGKTASNYIADKRLKDG
jgi:signal transduction histidine kinase/ligand-binding sensor domain-containing protein/DNA-binding NarL/FixJ family response regulator